MKSEISRFEKSLDYVFKNKSLLQVALTHSSHAYESTEKATRDNEVLEFLGDSVLGFVLADFLCTTYPRLSEGELSKLKSAMASTSALHSFALRLRIDKHILLGKGEIKSGGRKKKTILAGAFEALVAALYLDGGIQVAQDFLYQQFDAFIKKIDMEKFLINNYKSALQEILQKEDPIGPVYTTITTKGPDHKKKFVVEVSYQDKKLAKARGLSKKDAEQKAAQKAMRNLMGKKIRSLTSDTFLVKKKHD